MKEISPFDNRAFSALVLISSIGEVFTSVAPCGIISINSLDTIPSVCSFEARCKDIMSEPEKSLSNSQCCIPVSSRDGLGERLQ